MNLSGQRLELVFEDSGKPFNPLQEIESPDLEADSEQRSAGGFGFFIVQELTDGVEYHHEDGKNRLVVVRLLEKDH
jgi:sigma-B regulation protein RsbU (phosphoserine phosphatase)